MDQARKALSFLEATLIDDILDKSDILDIPSGTELLKEGQYVKVIPIVLEGLVKVYTSAKERELLLYYIQPEESCIMSFAACLKNEKSKVFAITESDTKALLLSTEYLNDWIKNYPNFNHLFYEQYNKRYSDLLDTIEHVLFNKMDVRLYDYLLERVNLTSRNPIKISHRQIANELGTAREVITRTVKKLETDGRVIQHPQEIEILKRWL